MEKEEEKPPATVFAGSEASCRYFLQCIPAGRDAYEVVNDDGWKVRLRK